jgi:hypothetical protein
MQRFEHRDVAAGLGHVGRARHPGRTRSDDADAERTRLDERDVDPAVLDRAIADPPL